ncbi:sigma-70 family RNA polymerase sigma factor [Nocardioides sp. CFH 31398]|uniref:sigma-70 family RNA polymerase sigma factor n=1 Tax=Nocardioides sp. CFH 31398 TaxID=2919579 RepID=UPI001F059D78|nr:sigma-70 family RNA polymerase sigma factor [Nocardioides sp. CFH 31398]MCH1865140.1 sigma-70 family RNA polymerase sigma factor [Nocardioides sp. CFH 31398]
MTDGRAGPDGLAALREAVLRVLSACAVPQAAAVVPSPGLAGASGHAMVDGMLLSEQAVVPGGAGAPDDHDLAVSSEDTEEERTRLIALVELARGGDRDAFGELYDHYHPSVYRFLYYRTRSVSLAEDLAADTFFRALRNMDGFRWQGRDFGAWLMTIARNLTTDHFKAGKTRLESATEDMSAHDGAVETVESTVMGELTNEMLLRALTQLPTEQQECLIMRFLQGLSIAETAAVLGRSDGAVKQLQLRGVRNLAKLVPEGIRDR